MFKMVLDKVLVQPEAAKEKSDGGVYFPETSMRKVPRGTVLAVGPGNRSLDGTYMVPEVKVGDEVLYNQAAGTELEVGNQKLLILRETEILCIKSS